MSAISDEEIIRRKLTIEGEGGAYDKKIAVLTKTFIQWCSTMDDAPAEREAMTSRLLGMIDQLELGMVRTSKMYEMNLKEQERYKDDKKAVETEIDQMKAQIEDLKKDLEKAKTIRKNKQEYDAMTKAIVKLPDRKETSEQLDRLSEELNALKETEVGLQKKIDLRVQQFQLIFTAAADLKRILDEDTGKEESSMETG